MGKNSNLRMAKFSLAFFFFMTWGASLPTQGAHPRGPLGPQCHTCGEKVQELTLLQDEKAQLIKLLGKNNRYLAAISAEQASKFLKVNSNRVLILKKLDQIKAKEMAVRKAIRDGECLACLPSERHPDGEDQ